MTKNKTKLSAEQIAKLNEAQRDGRACVHCAGDEGALRPIGWLDGCQVFEHAACGERPPAEAKVVSLVAGPGESAHPGPDADPGAWFRLAHRLGVSTADLVISVTAAVDATRAALGRLGALEQADVMLAAARAMLRATDDPELPPGEHVAADLALHAGYLVTDAWIEIFGDWNPATAGRAMHACTPAISSLTNYDEARAVMRIRRHLHAEGKGERALMTLARCDGNSEGAAAGTRDAL